MNSISVMESNQFRPTEASEQPNQPKGSKRKSTAAIIGILIGIVAVLLVVNALIKDKPVNNGNRNVIMGDVNQRVDQSPNVNIPTNANRQTNTNTQKEAVSLEDINLNVANWKTYGNEKYGLGFKYPKELALKFEEELNDYVITFEMPEKIIRDCICRMSITIADNSNNLALAEWMKQKGFMTLDEYEKEKEEYGSLAGLLEQKKIVIDGFQAIEYDRGMEGGGAHTVFIPLDKKIVVISGGSELYVFNNASKDSVMRRIYDTILSTLVLGNKM